MPEPFAVMLQGGHANSLGRTEEAVGMVLADHARLEELFATMSCSDELVRMRAGDALEKICRVRPDWLVEHAGRLLGDMGQIDQPSVQWHVAQMLNHLRHDLSEDQMRRAIQLLQRNLAGSTDWIVLNVTMDVLAQWARNDPRLAAWLAPHLERLQGDARPSVAKRASKRLRELPPTDKISRHGTGHRGRAHHGPVPPAEPTGEHRESGSPDSR